MGYLDQSPGTLVTAASGCWLLHGTVPTLDTHPSSLYTAASSQTHMLLCSIRQL